MGGVYCWCGRGVQRAPDALRPHDDKTHRMEMEQTDAESEGDAASTWEEKRRACPDGLQWLVCDHRKSLAID